MHGQNHIKFVICFNGRRFSTTTTTTTTTEKNILT